MISIYDVIKKPLITEKAMILKENDNQVVFSVHPQANKKKIKNAVEELFDVKVKDVKTMNFKGKKKRFGLNVGKRDDWKKAVIILEDDQKLEFV